MRGRWESPLVKDDVEFERSKERWGSVSSRDCGGKGWADDSSIPNGMGFEPERMAAVSGVLRGEDTRRTAC
jgi:hypothetical protein